MTIDRRALKAEAREHMRTATPRPVYEGLLFVLLSGAFFYISGRLLSAQIDVDEMIQYMNYLGSGSYAQAVKLAEKLQPTTADYLVSTVLQLFQSFASAGFSLFALRSLRGDESCSLWNLFDGFGVFSPLLLVLILTRLLTMLWLQLLVIPGLIAFYRYRLAVYLVLDHPRLGGFRAILLSGGMMHGHKGQLFALDLSFAGWFLLALLPYAASLFAPGLPLRILGALGSTVLFAGLATYHRLSCTLFYEKLRAAAEKAAAEIT